MTREEMLNRLTAITGPLVSLTAFSDGVICDYMTHEGCGGFELLDWNDLNSYDYDSPDRTWGEISDDELEEWIRRLESGDFNPPVIPSSDSASTK